MLCVVYVVWFRSNTPHIHAWKTMHPTCPKTMGKSWENHHTQSPKKVNRTLNLYFPEPPNHGFVSLIRSDRFSEDAETNATSMRWTKTTILNGRRPYLPKLPGRHGIQSRRCSVLVNLPPLLLRAYWSWVSLNKAKLCCKLSVNYIPPRT